mmetsp:Transcript_103190/g.205040  ORF Transcript_103190/g.205040 Transcript_103190/m.205040 type:complete len:633 (+) Transcript_103190:51-1949(+)
MASCWLRSGKLDDDGWLSKQLKNTREQLDRKARLCDQLAHEVHALQSDLEARAGATRDLRKQLSAANAELRAAAHSNAVERAAHSEQAMCGTSLQMEEEVSRLREALSQLDESHVMSREKALNEAQAARELCEAESRLKDVEMERVRDDWDRQKSLHEEAVRLLKGLQQTRAHEVNELSMELTSVSVGLEQKEDDILSIQFEMVDLQNQLRDQAQLVIENADAFQQASEELADKDEKLEVAAARQEQLLAQMSEVSLQLQEKVTQLTQELEGSRKAYHALDERTRLVVAGLESDRDALAVELARARTEAATQCAEWREQLRSREAAAAEVREALEHKLYAAQAKAERGFWELNRMLALEEESGSVSEPSTVAVDEILDARGAMELSDMEVALLQRVAAKRLATGKHSSVCHSTQRTRDLEEQLALTTENLVSAEAQVFDLAAALERSRLLERQAQERAQEYQAMLQMRQDFLVAAPREVGDHESTLGEVGLSQHDAAESDGNEHLPASTPGVEGLSVPSVLIAIELDLGQVAGTAVLSIAPWQTRSDFDAVVKDFLEENRVKPLFAGALVRFLEKVEREAEMFPAKVKANLAEVYSRYGSEGAWQEDGSRTEDGHLGMIPQSSVQCRTQEDL